MKFLSFSCMFTLLLWYGVQFRSRLDNSAFAAFSADAVIPPKTKTTSWCDNVAAARSKLDPDLYITYPCEELPAATSAIVCFLTAGVEEGKANRIVFSARDYINGALALGASLEKHVTRPDTHRLLLIRKGFTVPPEDMANLRAVGWTVGKAPAIQVAKQYTPSFARHTTTYTKISAIGVSEYKCTLLMDADALAVDNLDELLSCDIFDRAEYRVAGTLDYYRSNWEHFNTGSVLLRNDAAEMNRVYALTKDDTFMQRFDSDQIFLNHVYPDRTNRAKNKLILLDEDGSKTRESWGSVARLPWDYNAQTHVEGQLPIYWEERLDKVKIIHFTQKKGWQCPEMYRRPPPEEIPEFSCKQLEGKLEIPLCYCREGYRYWVFLREARVKAGMDIVAVAPKR